MLLCKGYCQDFLQLGALKEIVRKAVLNLQPELFPKHHKKEAGKKQFEGYDSHPVFYQECVSQD